MITAVWHDSGFALSRDIYNAITAGSDGRIYYVLCSDSVDIGAQMYVFDPETQTSRHLGDLTEACGEKGLRAIPQGKSHVNFVECEGRLYFATHVCYYTLEDGKEVIGAPPPGYKPYPGGHFLCYDMKTGAFEDLALAPGGDGIISMTMDAQRGRLYGLTWPNGMFVVYDLRTKTLQNLGPVANAGEAGRGATFQTICRSLIVDPRDGAVYFTDSTGTILRCRYGAESIEPVAGDNLRKDYFGQYNPAMPGHMGYHWRQTVWSEEEQAIYGVHGNSGYLFRFDPSAERLEVVERIASLPSKRSGMFDQFSYGYLGFSFGPDGHTLHYLTGGPVYENGRRVAGKESTAKGEAKGIENLHLVTFDTRNGEYRDHGAVFLPDGSRPSYVNSIAVGRDGTVYTLARVTVDGVERSELISFPGPLSGV